MALSLSSRRGTVAGNLAAIRPLDRKSAARPKPLSLDHRVIRLGPIFFDTRCRSRLRDDCALVNSFETRQMASSTLVKRAIFCDVNLGKIELCLRVGPP